jgi:uncharacterized protein (TIGR02996 family)
MAGSRWIEFASPIPVVLTREGAVMPGFENTYIDPELLIFDPPPVAFRLKGERKWGGIKAPHLVELNGEYVESGVVKIGDRLRWWDYEIKVVEVPKLSDEERAMVDASRTSDAALNVYADWLESHGAVKRAEWARLMLKGKIDQTLLQNVGPSFRALVTRARIERCSMSCNQSWESLPLGEDPCVRNCLKCMRPVTWCEDASIARSLREEPVVIDRAAPRSPGDLRRPNFVVG